MDVHYTACNISEDNATVDKWFSPKRALFRYSGLLLICLLSFGGYFCYDNPGALQDRFIADLNITTREFSVFYSVYAWPNVFLCFFGGFLLDSVFGVRWGTIVYLALALCGQLLFALGVYINFYWLMVFGRFIFGMGAESVNIAQNSYIVMWFSGNALNLLFGLQWSFSQLGSTVNSLTMGNVYKLASEALNDTGHECLGIALFLAAMTTGGSMICALMLGYMDSHHEKVLERNKGKKSDPVKLADIKDFQVSYWLIVIICSAYCVAVFPFTALAKMYFMVKYEFDADSANRAVSLIYIISALTSPLFGVLIDKFGKNIIWVICSLIGSSVSRALLTFTQLSPYACMTIFGISSSIFITSAWPMIAHVIPEHQLGTAYGINQSLLNMSIAVATTVCGAIVDNYGYFVLDLFFLIWLSMSLIPAFMFWMINQKSTDEKYDIVAKPNANEDQLVDGLLQPLARSTNEKSCGSLTRMENANAAHL